MQHFRRMVHLYAEGRPGQWEAFCLEFDIAVQGVSLDDVKSKLHDQVLLYVESVFELPEADQVRLLNRRAPLLFRLRVWWRMMTALWNQSADRKQRASYDCPLDGAALAA